MLSVCSEGPQFASCIGSTNISMSRLSLLVASPNSRPPCVEASGFHKFFSCIFSENAVLTTLGRHRHR